MSAEDDAPTVESEDDWSWRLVKKKDSSSAILELGDMYADAPDDVVNALLHIIGEGLIKAGTQMIQSRLADDDEDDDDDYY